MQRTSQNREAVESGESSLSKDLKNSIPDEAKSSSSDDDSNPDIDDSENSNPNNDSHCSSKHLASGSSSPYKLEPTSPIDPSVLSKKNHHVVVKEMRDQSLQCQAVNRTANDFYFLKILGEGSFSTVYLVEDVKTKGKFALKIMLKDSVRRERKTRQVGREKDIGIYLTYAVGGHPLVTKLYCTFHDSYKLYFVFNHAKNGELYDLLRSLGKFNEEIALFYITEIVDALFFIHRCKVVHRDLKPENILLGADWHIIISDFGSAKVVGDKEQEQLESQEAAELRAQGQTRGSFVGTAQYISPEVLQSQLAGYEADFWAVGAILYQMLTGQVPFRASNEYHIMRRVMNLQYEFPEGILEDARDLISKFLVLEPERRLGSIAMGGQEPIKNHPYFKSIDWSNVPSRTPPDFTHLLPSSWENEHSVPNATPDMEPGLCEDAVNRMMGFGKYAVDPEPAPLTQEQLDELKLAAQRDQNVFHKFVKDNLIIKFGFIDKKKGLFARRRMFLLTEGPHLFYVDPVSMQLRGEVPFSKELRVEAKNFRAFFVHVPGRTYILFDPERNAKKWCDAIEEVRQKYFGDPVDDPQPFVDDVRSMISEFSSLSQPGSDVLESMEKVTKNTAKFLRLAGPVGSLIAARLNTTFEPDSDEQKAIAELHNGMNQQFKTLNTVVANLEKTLFRHFIENTYMMVVKKFMHK